MPRLAPKPCNHTGCPNLTQGRYCDDHADQHKHNWQDDRYRGTRQQRGYGKEWQRIRAARLRQDHYLCQVCIKQDRTTPATEVDHIISKANGGTDHIDNLQSICKQCHRSKTARERQ